MQYLYTLGQMVTELWQIRASRDKNCKESAERHPENAENNKIHLKYGNEIRAKMFSHNLSSPPD